MILLGLTGGIGMGKSVAANLLAEQGCPVIDTDVLARQVVEPGQPALEEIQACFGPEVVDSSGCLRREEIARQVFAEPALRRELEKIVHPRIRELWKTEVEVWRKERRPFGVVVIPLLFETGASGEFDKIICVACKPETQLKRLRDRGWTELEIRQRIAAQAPIEEKITSSHFVVWTEGSLEVHAEQLKGVLASLGATPARIAR